MPVHSPNRSRIARYLSEWRSAGPDFLWVPESQDTLLLDQAGGLRGRVLGNKPLGYGGLDGTVNNNGTDWIEFDTNVGITANNTRFIGFALVSIPDAGNASGCYLKIGSNANGLGFGFGNTTFENAGSKLIILREGIAWFAGTGTQLVNGLNVLSFGVAEDGSDGITVNHNTTTGVEAGTGAASTAAISAQLRINGYTTLRGTGSVVHAVAIFKRSLTTAGNKFVDFRSKLTAPARTLDRIPANGVRKLFEPKRIWVPGLSVGGAGTNLASSGGALQASAVGTLTTKAALSGAGTLAASGTGALSTGSLGTNLASSGGLLQASAVGTLTTKAALAGAGTLAASGTGALSTGSSGTNLASSGGLLQASAVGTLTTKAALAGAGALAASGAGTLSTGSSGATLASSGGLLQASAVGTLTTKAALAGAGALAASGTGALSTGSSGANLASSGGLAPASGSGSLATRAALQATLAIAQASATAALTVRALLAGAGLAACRGTGTLALDGTGLDVFTTSGRARVGATALEATPGRIGSSPFATTAARRIGGRSL